MDSLEGINIVEAKAMREAYHFERQEHNIVLCTLCPHYCTIPEECYGRCRVRVNKDGTLYTLNYGEISAFGIDPIEKKPLRHFYPGQQIVSIGSFGCNLECDFCQNWSIAQEKPKTIQYTADDLLDEIKDAPNNIGIAYTYNEPTIFYEFMLDTAKKVYEAGYKNVMVSNGFINKEPLEALLPYIDAFNIDLKGFNDAFYHGICSGERLAVMETIERIVGVKHIEITLLLIDGLNTNPLELEALFRWVGKLDSKIPLHISRYFPAYKMDQPPTQIETLYEAKTLADQYLEHVYPGNVPL